MRTTPPERPLTSTTGVDTALELSQTVLTILNDVSGVFTKFPYVGAVAGVIQQFITIRNEIKANETLCLQIIDKVLRRSKSVCDDLATIANSNARERLIKLEGSLREYERELQMVLCTLKRHQTRHKWEKAINRGVQELNETAQRLNDFNLELMLRILVDIKTEQAASANGIVRVEATEFVAMSDEIKHVLPPRPHLMVEREAQLNMTLDILLGEEPSRIAILGGGGFGKTTLARTILHDPKVTKRYKFRYFLSCEALPDVESLLLGIGSMLDIKASPTTMLASIRRRLETSTTLLCLDNFETPWEPSGTRTKVEDVLASIADIPNLSLMITTRGTQRPSKIAWSRPLLPPLSTVSSESAQKILLSICPDHKIDEPTQNLLDAVDGIPLAITLISNLLQRDGETAHALWTRWSKGQTKIIENGGDDRESNLNASIALSVCSPRTKKDPDAIVLLATLSLLPDGFPLAEIEELAEYLSINDVHRALQTLRAVALIHSDKDNPSPRIQMLSPIRLYCLASLSSEISSVLEKVIDYYISVMLWAADDFIDLELYALVVPEIQNIHSVLQRVYKVGYSQDISSLVDSTCYLTDWSCYIGYPAQDTIQMALRISDNFPLSRANCLASLGRLYDSEGQYAKAETCLKEAAVLISRENDVIWEANTLRKCSEVLTHMCQFDQAEAMLKAALQLYIKADAKRGEANVCLDLGVVYMHKDLPWEADAAMTAALEAYKQIPNLWGQINAAQSLAQLHCSIGGLVKAEKLASESLDTAKQADFALGIGNALYLLGCIYFALDRVPDARQATEQALTINVELNISKNQLLSINRLGKIGVQSDQLSSAEELLTSSISAKGELDMIEIPIIVSTLGWLYIHADRFDKAEPLLNDALQYFRKLDLKVWQAEVIAHLGILYLKSNRLEDAERALNSISNLKSSRDIKIQQLWGLGDLYIVKGKLDDAEASLDAAMAFCRSRVHEFPYSYQQGNILRSMGILHMKRARVDRAIRAFKSAREFHRKAQWVSEQATDLKRLGEAYEMLERTEEAEVLFKEAVALMESVREARTLKP